MEKNRTRAYVIIAGVVIAIGGMLVAARTLRPAKLDPLGCAPDIPSKTVILLDHSQTVPKQTSREILLRATEHVLKKTQPGELVSVFTVSELSRHNLVPLFSYCRPKDQAAAFTENERLVKRTFQEKFVKPIEAALGGPIPDGKQSPLAQAIIDISLSGQFTGSPRPTLIIFSDMLEYTKGFSLYGCTDSKGVIPAFRASRGASVARPSFHDATVELNVIPRSDVSASVAKCRDGFWAWFFGDNQGVAASFNRYDLPG